MTQRSSADRLLRRSRIISLGAAAGASVVTIGLIAGVTHSQVATTSSGTTTSGTSSSTGSNTTTNQSSTSGSGGTVAPAPAQGQPIGGSHGS